MRSTWLFYIVFPGQLQHSAATAFLTGVGEVVRRFMWNFFRVENEHMMNVSRFMASRDVPLPFSLHEPRTNRKVTREAEISMMDYTRMEGRRSVTGQDDTGYDC